MATRVGRGNVQRCVYAGHRHKQRERDGKMRRAPSGDVLYISRDLERWFKNICGISDASLNINKRALQPDLLVYPATQSKFPNHSGLRCLRYQRWLCPHCRHRPAWCWTERNRVGGCTNTMHHDDGSEFARRFPPRVDVIAR